jgi:hypothetical protein
MADGRGQTAGSRRQEAFIIYHYLSFVIGHLRFVIADSFDRSCLFVALRVT